MAQVTPLQSLVIESAYQPILFPTLQIEALNNTPSKDHYAAIIFISVNAVQWGWKILNTLNHHDCQIFAVGGSTAKKLAEYGFKVNVFPAKKASSEALLAMPEVRQLYNQNILIFRGRGGRETLKAALGKNNTVEYIEVYQRTNCAISANHKAALKQFLQNKHGVIVITSIESLSNMLLMIGKINTDATVLIQAYPLVVFSARIKVYARSLGFRQIEVAPQTNDKGLIQAIKRLKKT